jgi:hypothetical protein
MPTDADLQQVAQEGSQFTVILHDHGTNYTDERVAINQQQDQGYAFDLWVAGTNYTNSQVIASQGSENLALFWAGTAFTNQQVSAESAARIAGDNQIMSIAVAGTNALSQAVENGSQFATILHDAGTDYANTRDAVVASNGTSYVEILAGQTVRQANLAYAGTTVVDFNGRGMLTVNVTGNVVFDAVNMAAERYCSVRVLADSGTRTLGFHGSWRFLGQKPSQINANKVGVLSLSCFGATSADVLAAWGVEQ